MESFIHICEQHSVVNSFLNWQPVQGFQNSGGVMWGNLSCRDETQLWWSANAVTEILGSHLHNIGDWCNDPGTML